eukprot:1179984-Prorocentrum_minimum.AAC.6
MKRSGSWGSDRSHCGGVARVGHESVHKYIPLYYSISQYETLETSPCTSLTGFGGSCISISTSVTCKSISTVQMAIQNRRFHSFGSRLDARILPNITDYHAVVVLVSADLFDHLQFKEWSNFGIRIAKIGEGNRFVKQTR